MSDQTTTIVLKVAVALSQEERDEIGRALRIRDAARYHHGRAAGLQVAAQKLLKLAFAEFSRGDDASADWLRELSRVVAALPPGPEPSAEESDFAFGLLYGMAEDEP